MKRILLVGCLGWLLSSAGTAETASTVVQLSVPVSGVVEEVLVEAGERVNQGQLLLRLHSERFDIEVKRAEAALTLVQVDLEDAQLQLTHELDLHERMVSSDRALLEAKNRLRRSEAKVQMAEADHQQALLDLQRSQLRAPLPGVILERHAEPGEVVSSRDHPPVLLLLGVAGGAE